MTALPSSHPRGRAAVAAAALLALLALLTLSDASSMLLRGEDAEARLWEPSAAARRVQMARPSGDGGGGATMQPGRNFMVGYGSLMNARSRAKTGDTGSAFPARVSGFRREWSYGQSKRSMTALGARQTGSAADTLNAVIVTVAAASLPKFDEREQRYRRVLVPHASVKWLGGGAPPPKLAAEDRVWVYVNEDPAEPTEPLPIMQSYVDVVLEGCLKYGDEFARECVRTTHLWEDKAGKATVTWVNDREAPKIYERGFVPAATVAKIDALLREVVPAELAERKPLQATVVAKESHVVRKDTVVSGRA